MSEFFGKLKKGVGEGAIIAAMKSKNMIEISKLKSQISAIEVQKKGRLEELGIHYYTRFAGAKLDEEQSQQILSSVCLAIQEMEQLMNQKQQEILAIQEAEINTIERMKPQSCSCGEPIIEGSLFCKKCGTKLDSEVNLSANDLTVKCNQCGKLLKTGVKFCGGCGSKIELLLQEEISNKQLFCNICGEKQDPTESVNSSSAIEGNVKVKSKSIRINVIVKILIVFFVVVGLAIFSISRLNKISDKTAKENAIIATESEQVISSGDDGYELGRIVGIIGIERTTIPSDWINKDTEYLLKAPILNDCIISIELINVDVPNKEVLYRKGDNKVDWYSLESNGKLTIKEVPEGKYKIKIYYNDLLAVRHDPELGAYSQYLLEDAIFDGLAEAEVHPDEDTWITSKQTEAIEYFIPSGTLE